MLDTDMFNPLYKSLLTTIKILCDSLEFNLEKNLPTRKCPKAFQKTSTRPSETPYLEILGLPALQYRSLLYNMIQVFRIIHGFDKTSRVSYGLLPLKEERRTRNAAKPKG